MKLGDRIAIMRDGVIVQEGTPVEIVTAPEGDYVSAFIQDVARAKVIRAGAVMRAPDVLVRVGDEPAEALRAMQAGGADSACLVEGDGVLKGMVTADRASALAREGAGGLGADAAEPAMTTRPNAFIEDIIPKAARTEYPVAVVDGAGRLLGQVNRRALLEGMSEGDDDD